MNLAAAQPVLASLTPVFLLIGVGFMAGRAGWIRAEAVKDLSNLVFLLLIPALLFRTMSGVHIEQLDLRPIAAYFVAALGLLAALVGWLGLHPRGVVTALAGVFSNMVMIGITLVELAYGQQGLVTLLTLVSVHALVLLTVATVVLEVAVAKEAAALSPAVAPVTAVPRWRMLLVQSARVARGALIHPIPLPILCGLLFAQTGWVLPPVVDKPLQLLGNAFGPMALVLVGVTLARTPVGAHWRGALGVSLSKNLVLPLLVGVSAWAFGISGLPMTVMVVAAALPIGANVFLFSQRYNVAHDLVTASLGVSTVLAMLTLSAIMLWLA
ncbi:MAG: AEC family transporter [Burkholderiaceae bacterium]|nr:AEC family transporter [Burkholderiaceae bacterium]MDZ4162589.1 AEC family transporter [Burkholderiales bacterium]